MNRTLGMLPLLAALALGGCSKELTAGGFGEVSTVATDEDNNPSTARYALLPGVGEQSVPLATVEGAVEMSMDVSLVSESGVALPITGGAAAVEVEIGTSARVPLGTEVVPVGLYPAVRLSFHEVGAEVQGLVLGGTVFAGTVTVDLGQDGLEVEFPVPVNVREDEDATVVLHLHSMTWLSLAQLLSSIPPGAVVSSDAFREAIEVTAESSS
ncbi:MAG: hypothetical protein GEU90_17580 [Gemmatimonas sp.]|nr:hypothetical protein [Gemmatimonas sp.]